MANNGTRHRQCAISLVESAELTSLLENKIFVLQEYGIEFCSPEKSNRSTKSFQKQNKKTQQPKMKQWDDAGGGGLFSFVCKRLRMKFSVPVG